MEVGPCCDAGPPGRRGRPRDDRAGARRSVGERLREARPSAGMTLEQVSAGTRIRVPAAARPRGRPARPRRRAPSTRAGTSARSPSAVGVDPVPLVRAFDARIGAAAPRRCRSSRRAGARPAPADRRPVGAGVRRRPTAPQPRWLSPASPGLAVLVACSPIGTCGDGGADARARAGRRARSAASRPPSRRRRARSRLRAACRGPRSRCAATGRSWLSVRNRGGVRAVRGHRSRRAGRGASPTPSR